MSKSGPVLILDLTVFLPTCLVEVRCLGIRLEIGWLDMDLDWFNSGKELGG